MKTKKQIQPVGSKTISRPQPIFSNAAIKFLALFGLVVPMSFVVQNTNANPLGLAVQSGTASATSSGSQLTVTVSQGAVLNWQSFNINAGEKTIFQEPSSSSVVINQIFGQSPSQIFGSLQANGMVILQNPSGFYFGPNSFVRTAGLIVSTAPLVPQEFSSGAFWQFNGPPPQASIINYGQIHADHGGSVFLISDNIENHGTIKANGGNIGLFAGQDVLISERPDGRGLSAQVKLPTGSVDNTGGLIADAGTIALNAKTVNQNGLLQANSVHEQNGVIELIASDAITLGDNSVIQANGGKTGVSDAGQIEIKSGNTFSDSISSQISVTGGIQGGAGGQVEISAPSLAAIQSQIDGHAQTGNVGGRLVIDPTTINIGTTGSGSIGTGTVSSGSTPTTLTLNVNSSFTGFSQIDLQATGNILVNSPWNLVNSTGISSPGSQLTLEAGNSINIANGASIIGGAGWSVTLEAGRNFSSPTPNAITLNAGSISLTGSGTLQTLDGSITLLAGKNITVGTGSVVTTGGGSINVNALAGNVATGTGVGGYDFLPGGYQVDANLGGISTANGGNVTINAGGNITSYLPVSGNVQEDAGTGAFGAAPGNVTLTAAGNIVGHYVVANGTGTINAGGGAGTSATLLALSLISGGWNVTATQDILLQEVRNPNGIFNERGFGSSTSKHFFDYAPDDYVSLTAGNSVQLLGTSVPRNNDSAFEQSIPSIYPGTLTINAGAGGVTLGNDVILFPSPQGQLSITTTGGGSLVGAESGTFATLVMSDSGKTQYQSSGDFGISDHAAVPVHLNDFTPVSLNISGDMDNILLGVPKAADVVVSGNMNNSRFEGQNLHPTDVTSITVAGDIINRNDFTTVSVPSAPDFTALSLVYPPLTGTLTSLPTLFSYNPVTGQLTFQGRMTGDQENLLLNLQVETLDVSGTPIVDAGGNVITHAAQFISPALLQQLFNASQDIPLNPNTGYLLGGGGQFNISAHNMDLGATLGIVSLGPKNNNALANYFLNGAAINVNLTGNLDMFSTTISSLNGGDINVNVGGTANLGSTFFTGDDTVPRGIFTVEKANVSVTAGGDINIDGSRIAAYDGGNISVTSLTGSVDAGTGGFGSVPVEEIKVDPITREILDFEPIIPGSGILATSFPLSLVAGFPPSVNTPGNITVRTPEGNVTANSGGIVQLPLNGVNSSVSTVSVIAGSRDSHGNVLYVGNIDVENSGVVGSTVDLEATGNITGVVIGRNNVNLNAVQSVNATVISGGDATISAGQTLQGTVFASGGIDAVGTTISATLQSQNISTSRTLSTSSTLGFATGTVANATTSSLQNDDTARRIAAGEQGEGNGLVNTNSAGSFPRLTKTTGRVSVILPNSIQP